MMFRLKRPCSNCPFRVGQGELFQIPRLRLREILAGPAFQCHKTVDYSGEGDDGLPGDRPQQCAGLMAVLHREGRHNQIMQVAVRMGFLDPEELDPDREAYSTVAETMEAHGRIFTRRRKR
jgi:hypothetical protein